MRETPFMRQVMLDLARLTRLFRNNVGEAWLGRAVRLTHGHRLVHPNGQTVALADGDVLINHARRVKFGLPTGSSDLIGWTPITITQGHVGQTLAVFTAVETKGTTTRVEPEQINFLQQVQRAGGIAALLRSPDDVARFQIAIETGARLSDHVHGSMPRSRGSTEQPVGN
jgi:hypothetical protein